MPMKKKFSISFYAALASLLLATASIVASSQQRTSSRLPFSRGEELFYEAEFKKGLLRGAKVGELRFSSQPAPSDVTGNDPLRLVGDALTKGFLVKLAGSHFHEHVESTINPDQFTP